MGQFSRFIRPGWRRIESVTEPRSGVYTSAYRNPDTKEIAIIAINDRSSQSNIALELSGAEFDSLDIWRTSSAEDLKPIGAQKVSPGGTIINLPQKSITTFYGQVK
jgi:O-glycosyl hydrolase